MGDEKRPKRESWFPRNETECHYSSCLFDGDIGSRFGLIAQDVRLGRKAQVPAAVRIDEAQAPKTLFEFGIEISRATVRVVIWLLAK